MIYYIMHIMKGYCRIEVKGHSKERFLKLLTAKQILIWRLIRKEESYYFYVSSRGCQMLEEIAGKTDCQYRCLSRHGLPYMFYRYRKRKILVLAVLISVFLIWKSSGYIWKINIEGSYTHSEEEMRDYLKKREVFPGVKKSAISCTDLEEIIRDDFKDISWVSCEKKGTVLTISLKEILGIRSSEKKPSFPCNLISARDGVIESIIVRKGIAKVKKGDRIKCGDILISGLVPLINDAGEITEEVKVPADGVIIAVTREKYHNSFPLNHSVKKYTGKQRKSLGINLFDHYYELSPSASDGRQKDVLTRKWDLHIGSQIYLPVSFYIKTEKEYCIEEKKYNKKAARKAMEKQLLYFIGQYEIKGVEILKNNVKIDCDDLECSAKGTIIMRERFGKIEKI